MTVRVPPGTLKTSQVLTCEVFFATNLTYRNQSISCWSSIALQAAKMATNWRNSKMNKEDIRIQSLSLPIKNTHRRRYMTCGDECFYR